MVTYLSTIVIVELRSERLNSNRRQRIPFKRKVLIIVIIVGNILRIVIESYSLSHLRVIDLIIRIFI